MTELQQLSYYNISLIFSRSWTYFKLSTRSTFSFSNCCQKKPQFLLSFCPPVSTDDHWRCLTATQSKHLFMETRKIQGLLVQRKNTNCFMLVHLCILWQLKRPLAFWQRSTNQSLNKSRFVYMKNKDNNCYCVEICDCITSLTPRTCLFFSRVPSYPIVW